MSFMQLKNSIFSLHEAEDSYFFIAVQQELHGNFVLLAEGKIIHAFERKMIVELFLTILKSHFLLLRTNIQMVIILCRTKTQALAKTGQAGYKEEGIN